MPTKRFSSLLPLTREGVAKVPKDRPGVFRIRNAKGDVVLIGCARVHRLDEEIYDLRAGMGRNRGTHFQYRLTADSEETERLQYEEINKHILPDKELRLLARYGLARALARS